ncbi:MAG: LD-carboxypeptidase, partial [Lachnospiraceae bacterium]|nr:LD-carboxypeptidase [Lachnospiraceae bacterium]
MKKTGIAACSNGHLSEWKGQVDELIRVLKGMDIEVVRAPHIYRNKDSFSGTDEERAKDLMDL